MTYAGIIASKHETAERIPHDHYPTPQEVVNAIAKDFHWTEAESILDVGAGDGRWGAEFAQLSRFWGTHLLHLAGVEIRETQQPWPFHRWYNLDYSKPIERAMMGPRQYDFIIGNPPFNVATDIVLAAMEQWTAKGRILMLLPSDFAHSITRHDSLLSKTPPFRVIHIADRIDFTGSGNPHQYMSLFEWRNGESNSGLWWQGSSWSWKAAK